MSADVEGEAFTVKEVVEVANGVLAVLNENGEYSLYFDTTKCRAHGRPFPDFSPFIQGFPRNTGLIKDVTARSWDSVKMTAQRNLFLVGEQVTCHDKPVEIDY